MMKISVINCVIIEQFYKDHDGVIRQNFMKHNTWKIENNNKINESTIIKIRKMKQNSYLIMQNWLFKC